MSLTAIHNIPKELFPVTMRAFRSDNGREVWGVSVLQPPPGKRSFLEIPPLTMLEGVPVAFHFRYGDGTADWVDAS